MNAMKQDRGFIQLIVILVLIVIILSLLGVSLSALFSDTTVKDNFQYIFSGIGWLWNNFLISPATNVFNFIKDITAGLIGKIFN